MSLDIKSFKSSPPRTGVSAKLIRSLGAEYYGDGFAGIGDTSASGLQNVLSYIKDSKFLGELIENPFIGGVVCTEAVSKLLPKRIEAVICLDPNWTFFSLVDALAENYLTPYKNVFESTIPPTVSVAENGVFVGTNVVFEPNVVVHGGVVISDNVIVRAGAVLGVDSFQHQRTSKGIISPKHDGWLIIKKDSEIGANSAISKGFSYRPTKIGSGSKLDAQVYLAHGASIGRNNIICTGVRVMGHARTGDNVFIGPASVVSSRVAIGNGARVSIGSIVTQDVKSGSTVSGNYAIDHKKWIEHLRAIR